MRSLARESVFKYLYSRLFNQNDEGLFEVLIKELNEDDKSFAKDLLDSVISNEEQFGNELENLVKGYKIDRVHSADKCAIILGMAELKKFPDTPKPVVIDEIVKISSKYSNEKSTDFVNGILAEYIREK